MQDISFIYLLHWKYYYSFYQIIATFMCYDLQAHIQRFSKVHVPGFIIDELYTLLHHLADGEPSVGPGELSRSKSRT